MTTLPPCPDTLPVDVFEAAERAVDECFHHGHTGYDELVHIVKSVEPHIRDAEVRWIQFMITEVAGAWLPEHREVVEQLLVMLTGRSQDLASEKQSHLRRPCSGPPLERPHQM